MSLSYKVLTFITYFEKYRFDLMVDKFKFKVIEVFRNYSLPKWFVLFIDILLFLLLSFSLSPEVYLQPETFEWPFAFKQALMVCCVYMISMLLFKSYSDFTTNNN